MARPTASERIRELEAYRRAHGHLAFLGQKDDERALRRWAVGQRTLWSTHRLGFDVERELRRIGFPLDPDDCEWEQKFAHALRQLKDGGKPPTATSFAGIWLDEQRELLKSKALNPERAARLRKIGALR
jgi:hypothetical protein